MITEIIKKLNNYYTNIRREFCWRFSLRALFTELDDIEINNPVFLLGVQGGGLTLLSRILRRNRTFVSVTGNNRYWSSHAEMQNVLRTSLPEPLRLRSSTTRRDFDIPESWYYAADPYVEDFRYTEQDTDDETKTNFRRLIRWLKTVHSPHPNSVRFLDKSQSFTLKVSYLDALLPNSRPQFVLQLRNPYAMSVRAANNIYPDAESMEKRIRRAAAHLSNSYDHALNDRDRIDGDMFVLRFEDLLQHPEYEVKQICDFLHIDFRPDMLPSESDQFPFGGIWDDKWYPIQKELNAPYLQELTPRLTNLIENRCGELIKRFNYSPSK